ncbi:hypothetical protein ACJJTC_001612 [Scirpophaga incertulas]
MIARNGRQLKALAISSDTANTCSPPSTRLPDCRPQVGHSTIGADSPRGLLQVCLLFEGGRGTPPSTAWGTVRCENRHRTAPAASRLGAQAPGRALWPGLRQGRAPCACPSGGRRRPQTPRVLSEEEEDYAHRRPCPGAHGSAEGNSCPTTRFRSSGVHGLRDRSPPRAEPVPGRLKWAPPWIPVEALQHFLPRTLLGAGDSRLQALLALPIRGV